MLRAGLDLSRRKIDVCLLAAGGEIVEEFASPPDADGLRGLTRRVGAHGVDKAVLAPRAATPAPASDGSNIGSNIWIIALGGGLLAPLMAGLLLRIRHRRASTPPAAPEAPGAA